MADKLGLDFALIHRKRKSRYRDRGSNDSQSQSRSGSTNQSRRQSPDFRVQLSSLQMNGIEPDGSVRGEPSDEDGMELLVGNVKDKTVVLVDDMIDTGVTVSLATRLLKDAGAARIFLLASHGSSLRFVI
jgi:ribose-phosphate pyrophosphokinase